MYNKQENVTRWFVMFKPWNKVVCIQPENSFYHIVCRILCSTGEILSSRTTQSYSTTWEISSIEHWFFSKAISTGLSCRWGVYKCFLRCINEWPLYLKFEAILTALCYDLDTWWELTYHQIKTNYGIIINHAHIRFVSEEKGTVGKIAKPGTVPPTARVSTSATANSNNSGN